MKIMMHGRYIINLVILFLFTLYSLGNNNSNINYMDKPDTIINWGISPNDQIINEIESLFSNNIEVIVKLDKNYPTSINSEAFIEEMNKLSRGITYPHSLKLLDQDFQMIFEPDNQLDYQVQYDQTISGILRTTKGGQPVVNYILVDKQYFKNINPDNNWREEIRKYINKMVEIQGDIFIYYPKPEEQSTEDGTVKKIENIKGFRVLE